MELYRRTDDGKLSSVRQYLSVPVKLPDKFQLEAQMDAPLTAPPKKRKATKRRGYAWVPGAGPEGETCKTCDHKVAVHYAKTFYKCGLMRTNWTGGYGTDILLSSPACKLWSKRLDNIAKSVCGNGTSHVRTVLETKPGLRGS